VQGSWCWLGANAPETSNRDPHLYNGTWSIIGRGVRRRPYAFVGLGLGPPLMGIRFQCPACHKKLNVKTFLAGKRGLCPKCGATVDIPTATSEAVDRNGDGEAVAPHSSVAAADSPALAAAAGEGDSSGSVGKIAERTVTAPGPISPAPDRASGDPIAEVPDAVWYVRPPAGGQFGPATADIMRRWLHEGRVPPEALVWREGWTDWKEAGPLFSSKYAPARTAPQAAPAPVSSVREPEQSILLLPTTVTGDSRLTQRLARRRSRSAMWAIVVCLGLASVVLIAVLIYVLVMS
jgi:hypothetical protein